MSQNNDATFQLKARRKQLKILVFGGGAVAAAQSFPDKWIKPVMSTAITPAHAQTTGPCDIFLGEVCFENENAIIDVLGTVPPGQIEAEINYASSNRTIASATPESVVFAPDGEVEFEANVDFIDPQDGANLEIEFVFESSRNIPNCNFETTLEEDCTD